MREPLVSILVPVYNVEIFLRRCLDSLLDQTLKEIEIICVDDGSTDACPEILEEYREKDSRIRVIHKANGGLPSARNAGLDAAGGKYVGFVDSDDYVEKNMFRKLYETAERKKSELVICGACIFPEEPRADSWLYRCLSPWKQHYDRFDPEILFDCACTTPFLWRTLIKRSLIEAYGLRLDERISIGEDMLFQTKVYPRAKGITVIPDKLYHYCWYREDSLMNRDVYHEVSQKARAHVVLVKAMAGELLRDGVAEEMRLSFLKWSIPFIYADYIALPLEVKIELAEGLLAVWEEAGYYQCKWKFESWIREQVDYIRRMGKAYAGETLVSVIVPVCDRTEYIEQALDSILGQSVELECILVNNGAPEAVYVILHKYLMQDKRVRLCNMDRKSYSEALNRGIELAVGKYITFCETQDWYQDSRILEDWVSEARRKDADLCIGAERIEESRAFSADGKAEKQCAAVWCGMEEEAGEMRMSDRACMDLDFHQVLYKRAFLERMDGTWFWEGSILTGLSFWVRALSEAECRSFYPRRSYVRRQMHRPDWISTEKCVKVLSVLDRLMEYSVERQEADIQAKVLSILNNDYYQRIIVNNTRAYSMPPKQKPKGENSQVEIFVLLYSILGRVEAEWLSGAGYERMTPYTDLLYELLRERHGYLAALSEGCLQSRKKSLGVFRRRR